VDSCFHLHHYCITINYFHGHLFLIPPFYCFIDFYFHLLNYCITNNYFHGHLFPFYCFLDSSFHLLNFTVLWTVVSICAIILSLITISWTSFCTIHNYFYGHLFAPFITIFMDIVLLHLLFTVICAINYFTHIFFLDCGLGF
jgi:hypothetical protein